MRFPNFLFVTLALIGASLFAPSANARSEPPHEQTHILQQLIAESPDPTAGSTVTLALVMRPMPGWHGYWVNPGDAGLGIDPRWTLPPGVTVGGLRYPPPEKRLLLAGLMNHVFEGPYAVLADLHIPANLAKGTRIPVELDARWLACTDKLCVPEQAHLTLDLSVGEGGVSAESRRRFDGFAAALPRPLGARALSARAGERIRIAIPYPAAAPVKAPWFYAATQGVVRYAEPQLVRRKGDMLTVETSLAPGAVLPAHVVGVLSVAPGVALTLDAVPGPVPAGGTLVTGEGEGSTESGDIHAGAFLLALGGALLGGLILNVMPCVFPILSLKAISLARAGGDEREARGEAIAYTLGALLSCMALGGIILALRAAGDSVGWAFQLQDNRVIALLLVLVMAITANLAGLFALPGLDGGLQGKGMRGALLTGILAAFVATPCTGPFMAAAMGAAILMPWPLALTIFAGLGLGLASPFLALAFIPALRRRLPRPGPWMEILRRIMAVPMALTALALGWLLWRQGGEVGVAVAAVLAMITLIVCGMVGRWQEDGKSVLVPALAGTLALVLGATASAELLPVRAAGEGVEGAIPFSAERLADLRHEGRPVFLYFTADWCLTCKVNEAGAIANGGVRRAFDKAHVVVMAGDWTKGDPAITRFLESQGRSGVPLYLYYAPGAPGPRVLPQILTPAMLTGLIG